jgi:hypothetical protein
MDIQAYFARARALQITSETPETVAANNSGVSSNSARQVPQSSGIPSYDGTQGDSLVKGDAECAVGRPSHNMGAKSES